MEQKIAFCDYFLNQREQSKEEIVNLPFCVCATRENRNAVVLPQNAKGDVKRLGIVLNKEGVTLISHEQVVNALIDNC